MALSDWFSNLHFLFRWMHVLAGIFWIGLLYFLNFIAMPVLAGSEPEQKCFFRRAFMPRVMTVFRASSLYTFTAGWILFLMIYLYVPGKGIGAGPLLISSEGVLTGRASWILTGITLGTFMFFSVWFIVYPAFLRMQQAEAGSAQMNKEHGLIQKTAKINCILTGPMLFAMIAPQNYPAFNLITLLVVFLISKIVFMILFKLSNKTK